MSDFAATAFRDDVVDTFTLEAPLLVNKIFLELYVPTGALYIILTYIVVDETVPEDPTTIGDALVPTLDAKVEDVDTSSPTGGFIDIPETIFVPDTENDVLDEAVPYVVDIVESVPVVDITDAAEVDRVIVDPFNHLTVVPVADVTDGIRYNTIDVLGLTVTDPVNVFVVELVWSVVPNVVNVPPLLTYPTVNLAVPELTAVFQSMPVSVAVVVEFVVSVTL